ncbi:hypothetical protein DdX_06284 [Ditylenchus destructor]|uniref:Uncharacterized protein n=1 Tax=Ditylenchus destructor TaxID=166010 RepID=A0AAD4R9P0_9BILA|nr:hypothetical protein DdX_06284 [Ditylenchus destructor]
MQFTRPLSPYKLLITNYIQVIQVLVLPEYFPHMLFCWILVKISQEVSFEHSASEKKDSNNICAKGDSVFSAGQYHATISLFPMCPSQVVMYDYGILSSSHDSSRLHANEPNSRNYDCGTRYYHSACTPTNPASQVGVVFDLSDTTQFSENTQRIGSCPCSMFTQNFYEMVATSDPAQNTAPVDFQCTNQGNFCLCTEDGECFMQLGMTLSNVQLEPFCDTNGCHTYALVIDQGSGNNGLMGDMGTTWLSSSQFDPATGNAMPLGSPPYLRVASIGCNGCAPIRGFFVIFLIISLISQWSRACAPTTTPQTENGASQSVESVHGNSGGGTVDTSQPQTSGTDSQVVAAGVKNVEGSSIGQGAGTQTEIGISTATSEASTVTTTPALESSSTATNVETELSECTPTTAQTVPLMFDPMDESIKLLNRPAADISVQAKVAILTGTAALQVKFDKMTISVSVVVFSLCLCSCPCTEPLKKSFFSPFLDSNLSKNVPALYVKCANPSDLCVCQLNSDECFQTKDGSQVALELYPYCNEGCKMYALPLDSLTGEWLGDKGTTVKLSSDTKKEVITLGSLEALSQLLEVGSVSCKGCDPIRAASCEGPYTPAGKHSDSERK